MRGFKRKVRPGQKAAAPPRRGAGRRIDRSGRPMNPASNTLMKMQLLIRRFAGTFILVSLLLAHYHSPYWLWFTAFVGFNLLQSSFTNFCPLEMILKKFGVGGACCSESSGQPDR